MTVNLRSQKAILPSSLEATNWKLRSASAVSAGSSCSLPLSSSLLCAESHSIFVIAPFWLYCSDEDAVGRTIAGSSVSRIQVPRLLMTLAYLASAAVCTKTLSSSSILPVLSQTTICVLDRVVWRNFSCSLFIFFF